MKTLIRAAVAIATITTVAMVAFIAAPALAATFASISGEATGNNAAGRLAASGLRGDWKAAIEARGGTMPQPLVLAGPINSVISGVIGTSPGGTTVSVQRTRYLPGALPTDPLTYAGVSPSENQGTAQCTGSGTTLQSSSPRPSVFLETIGCPNGNGFSYGEFNGVAGTDEQLYRDAVEFTFSGAGALAFGAWFGGLETRTDGDGVPALMRLYGTGDALLSETVIGPASSVPQDSCGGPTNGCGKTSTRWVGFTADSTTAVTRMVVIVGDDEETGDALQEGMSFIGPSILSGAVGIAIATSFTPLPVGPSEVGDIIHYNFTVSNTGDFPQSSVAITNAGAQNISCPTTLSSGSMACTAEHVITQPEIDLGYYTNTATVSGVSWGETVTSSASTVTTTLNRAPALTVAMTANPTTFSNIGQTLTFTISATNTGNTTLGTLSVSNTLPGATLDCATMPATLARGATGHCVATVAVAAVGADIVNTATVTSGALSVDSNAVTIRYVKPASSPTASAKGLASTGTDVTNAILTGMLLLLTGSAFIVARRIERSRSRRMPKA